MNEEKSWYLCMLLLNTLHHQLKQILGLVSVVHFILPQETNFLVFNDRGEQ